MRSDRHVDQNGASLGATCASPLVSPLALSYPLRMEYDFDRIIERRGTDSFKWALHPEDVIPLWVADMDFESPAPVVKALIERSSHGVFGYSQPDKALFDAIQERLHRLYGWATDAHSLILIPGVVSGINVAVQAFSTPGEAVLVQPPVYFHFLRDPVQHGRVALGPPLTKSGEGYEIDFDQFERAITDETRLFLLCNPHNPVGRAFSRGELERLAEICLRHDLVICSDEIHCDFVFPPYQHIPIATLAPEIAERTVTLMSPSKTYNVAGLGCGYAIIESPSLRRKWIDASYGLIPSINLMGHTAARAAMAEGGEWLAQAMEYLRGNRDFLSEYLRIRMPLIKMNKVEATYLAWLDCTEACIIRNPAGFFLESARVALSDGAEFGKGGVNHVRLNFACPRHRLTEALDRMKNALESM